MERVAEGTSAGRNGQVIEANKMCKRVVWIGKREAEVDEDMAHFDVVLICQQLSTDGIPSARLWCRTGSGELVRRSRLARMDAALVALNGVHATELSVVWYDEQWA